MFIHPEERAKSSPETSVNTKNMTPGNNPEASIHNNNHGESFQTHIKLTVTFRNVAKAPKKLSVEKGKRTDDQLTF